MPKRVGYAVVGLGGISEQEVLPAFRHSRRAKLVALVSRDANKARRLAAKFGAPAYFSSKDYAFALDHPGVEAVYIATPNATHPDLAIRAAEHGVHVLCEKPLATTSNDCRAMIGACRMNKVHLMTAYRKFFEPASLALKAMIESGRLGRIKIVQSAFTITLARGKQRPAWKVDRKLAGGGCLLDLGVYSINTVRWLLGDEPVEAQGYPWTLDRAGFKQVEENIAFRLNFARGAVLQAAVSYSAALASLVQLFGEKGWAALNPAFAYNEERRLFGKVDGRWFEKRFRVIHEFGLELDDFAQCIRQQIEPESSGEHGLRDVLVMEAIYRSAREGRAVPIR